MLARQIELFLKVSCLASLRLRTMPGGRVEQPRMVGDCHPLLVLPSLIGAQRFRYQPRILDGERCPCPMCATPFITVLSELAFSYAPGRLSAASAACEMRVVLAIHVDDGQAVRQREYRWPG